MNKRKIIITIMVVILIVLVGIYFLVSKGNDNGDALRFKEEYESLNGTVRESDGQLYNEVIINKDNPIKYVSVKEAVDIISNDSGIIYFGANWCPWCRNAVPVLLESAKKNNLDTIYYVNMDVARDTLEVKDGKAVKTYDGEEGYDELLKVMDSVLENYYITDENGEQYDTYEKRVYLPTVISFDNGEILDIHVATVSLNEGQTKYDKLTDSQHDELLDIYDNMIKSINSKSCRNDENC